MIQYLQIMTNEIKNFLNTTTTAATTATTTTTTTTTTQLMFQT
jgi:hypothetical protein